MSTAIAEPRTESWLTRNIPVDKIKVDGKNARGRTEGPEFDEFVDDVRQHGVLQAVLVRASGPKSSVGFEWHLIAGHRRLAAAKLAGQDEIPAVVSTLGPEHDDELRLVENLHRRDLHPLDEAEGYARLLEAGDVKNVARVAQRIGRPTAYVYNRMKLVSLIDDAKELLRGGRIELGHAIILARLSANDQVRAIDPCGTALFQPEGELFVSGRDEEFAGDGITERDPLEGLKTRTANELQAWVDANVRLEPKDVDPMLFPVTAEEVAASQKVIPITRSHYLQDSARSKEKTFGPQSWRRADGQRGSKTCALSVTGMVVAGDGRGEAFAVCVAKEKCTAHWSNEIKEKARRAKEREAEAARPSKATAPKVPKFDTELMDFERKVEGYAQEMIAKRVIEAAKGLTETQFLRALASARTWMVSDYLAFIGTDQSRSSHSDRDFAVKWVAQSEVNDLRACLTYGTIDDGDGVSEALGIDEAAIVKEHVAKAVAEFKAKRAVAATEAPAPKPRKRGAK